MALFHSLLPERSLTIKGELSKGGRKSREQLTVLLCCNVDGTEELKTHVIGKFAKSKCFRNITAFLVTMPIQMHG
jgi:hypothetical protein